MRLALAIGLAVSILACGEENPASGRLEPLSVPPPEHTSTLSSPGVNAEIWMTRQRFAPIDGEETDSTTPDKSGTNG